MFITLFGDGCVLVQRFVSFLRGIVHSRNYALKKGLKILGNPNNDKLLTICIPARKNIENIGLRGLSNVAEKSIAKPSLKLPFEPFLLPADMVVFLPTGFPTKVSRVNLIITTDTFEILFKDILTPSPDSSQNIQVVSKSPQQVFIHCTIQPVKSSVKRAIT